MSAVSGLLGYSLPDSAKQWVYDRYLNAQNISLPASVFTGNKSGKMVPLVFEDGKAELRVGHGRFECESPGLHQVLMAKYIPGHTGELEISCGGKKEIKNATMGAGTPLPHRDSRKPQRVSQDFSVLPRGSHQES